MNQSIITGLGTPQLSRIIEEGESRSRRIDLEGQEELDSIEEEIRGIGKELQALYHEMKKMDDKYSEEYLQKENTRNNLRKHLIDLDYKHKTIFARKHKQNDHSIIKQFNHPPTQQQTPKKNAKEEKEKLLFASPAREAKVEPKIQTKNHLEGSERRLRICEIETELAEQQLRRSRVQQLTRQLVYLRTSYSYPYSLHDYYPEYYYPAYSSLYSHWWLY